MQGNFEPHAIEESLYAEWEASGVFAPSGNGVPYSIVIPPPNVTGRLHMGHAFQHTLMDALIRYQRMSGRQTLWQTGTDHAGIATQMLVERQLQEQGVSRTELGRERFIDKVWDWRHTSGNDISRQLRRMGSSVDWSRERFTMDEGFSRAVVEVFVRLHEEGLVYRGKRLVNWDPELGTSISDLEVENHEEAGHLWRLRYPLADGRAADDGSTHLVVATTRPETMLGDTAVAVNPADERYRSLVGAQVELPLTGRRIPVIADEHVDPEFGTGCVKITPAHDFDDNEVGARHDLPLINIFHGDASLNDNAPAEYRGMDRYTARERIVADLDGAGLLDGVEEHTLTVPRGDRSGAAVEPWLTDQWFVRIAPLVEPAVAAVQNGDIEFVPKQYENMYFAWMRDVRDWCISRQQWWGHRIPAWHDAEGNIFVGRDEADARRKGGIGSDVPLKQDEDVLETWFSSALWTFGTLGWPEQTPELERFHPTDVLVTGFDIIFFWVARMIMMTLKFTGEIPFRKVYFHGMVRDAEGIKMSKTKGNGLDPLDLVDGIGLEELVAKRTENLTQPKMARDITARTRRDFPDGIPSYGADALRFTYCAMASQGRDLAFDLKRIEGYRNFCNKLWNATKFVLLRTETVRTETVRAQSGAKGVVADAPVERGLADRWIASRAVDLIERAHRAMATYRFDLYANAVYEFVWHEYCDWYVELTKPVLLGEGVEAAQVNAARRTLLEVLEMLLRVAHPVIPFITETLWRRIAPQLGNDGATIMTQPFPVPEDFAADPQAEADIAWLKEVVLAVRNIRGEMNIKPGAQIPLLLQGGGATDRERLANTEQLLTHLARLGSVAWLAADAPVPPASMQLVGELKVLVPMAGLIDPATERKRLGKEIDRLEGDLRRSEGKLANANFVARAPEQVVQKERDRAAAAAEELAALNQQLAALDDL